MIAKIDMNSHLFVIHDVLHHMMGQMKRQTAVLQEINDARPLERPRAPVPNRPRTPPGDGYLLSGEEEGNKRL